MYRYLGSTVKSPEKDRGEGKYVPRSRISSLLPHNAPGKIWERQMCWQCQIELALAPHAHSSRHPRAMAYVVTDDFCVYQ